MQFWEKLPMSWARKLDFKVGWSDIYFHEWLPSDYYLFFESGTTENSPIVLLWDWKFVEHTQSLIEKINKEMIQEWNICTFITKEIANIYSVDTYRSIDTPRLPLVQTEPVHSTESVMWELIDTVEIQIESFETQAGIQYSINRIIRWDTAS